MRIIGGTHKGRVIKTPGDLPLRPTTDFAKEALFNILNNQIDFSTMDVLDLFAGTGNISLEFASRQCLSVTAVEKNPQCLRFISGMTASLGLNVTTIKADVFEYLKHTGSSFDLIFADPPYDSTGHENLHQLVFGKGLLKPGALLIIEHGQKTHLDQLTHFVQTRHYGAVRFSFFRADS